MIDNFDKLPPRLFKYLDWSIMEPLQTFYFRSDISSSL